MIEFGIRTGIDAIEQGKRDQRRRSRRPSRQQYYPERTYQPRYTYPNQVRTEQSTPRPVAKVPVNVLPEFKPEPAVNVQASFSLIDKTQLENAADSTHDELTKTVDQLVVDQDKAIDKSAQDLIPPGNSLATQTAFLDAAATGDVMKVKMLASQMGVDSTALVAQIELAESYRDLQTLIAQPGTAAADIELATTQLITQASGIPGQTPAGIVELAGRLETMRTLATARDALLAASAAEDVTFPDGNADIIGVPGLPEDSITCTPDGQIIQGTGDDGEFSTTEGTIEDVVGMPVPAGEPVPEADADDVEDDVVIRNPQGNDNIVRYTLNGRQYSMQPGYSQSLSSGTKWLIVFDRGGNLGETRYTLARGTYNFSITDQGWELRSKSFEVTIDNSKSKNAFRYLLDGEQVTVAGGETKTHKSSAPLIISFDRGDNGEPATKKLESGTYQVGLDIEQRHIELYPVDDSRDLSVIHEFEDNQAGESTKDSPLKV